MDPCVADFLGKVAFKPDHLVPFEHWDPVTAQLTYLSSPLILTPRKNGYYVLGSGRAWRQAEQLFEEDEKFPALVLPARRLADDLKLRILAADLMGQFASHRTRPHLPRRMMAIWGEFVERGVPSIQGKSVKAFSRGTGYSLKALHPSKGKEYELSSPAPNPLTQTIGENSA